MASQEQLHTSSNTLTRRIHILSVIDNLYFGGDEYRLQTFGAYLDKNRFDHTVLTMTKEDRSLGDQFGSMRDQYRQSGIRLLDLDETPVPPKHRRPLTVVDRLISVRNKVHKLASVISAEKVDVLDVHLSPPNPICAFAANKTNTPFTVTLYQLDQVQSPRLWSAGQFNLGRAASLITDSEVQARKIKKWLLRGTQICVVPNGTPPPRVVTPRKEMLRLFDISESEHPTIIGQVSSFVSYKGQIVLLDAAKRVLEQHPNCVFLLVGYERGDAGYKGSLHRRAVDLGIADRVRIVSYPGLIGDVWNIIDIHVHASLLDSLPNALLEAMSLGKPSVLTAVGGIPDVINHGVNGLLATPGDSEQLAQRLVTLLEHDEIRLAIGREARLSYSRSFGPEIMTRRLEKLFLNLTLGLKVSR